VAGQARACKLWSGQSGRYSSGQTRANLSRPDGQGTLERDRAYTTNDDRLVIAYGSSQCPCTALIKDKLSQRHTERLASIFPKGASTHITKIGRWEEYGTQRKLGLELEIPPVDVQDESGKVVLHEDAFIQRELFTLSYDRDRWVIDDSVGYRRPQA